MTNTEIIDRIQQLKREKNAVILAHYYTRPEVQDIADYLGDSLGLSQEAGKTDADIIVFCGVHFMAETAAIISPRKKVLIPARYAGCSLAESITGYELREWKKVYAWTDCCCSSANALNVVDSIPSGRNILFVPDKNLGAWIMKVTGREMELWEGDCCVHERITSDMILEKSREYPEADILIHPESRCSHDEAILNLPQAYLYSTAGMIRHASASSKKQFIIATETETIHKLKKDNPPKEFIPIHPKTICGQMKKVTLENLLEALEQEQYEVKVPEEIRERAWLPIQRMLGIK